MEHTTHCASGRAIRIKAAYGTTDIRTKLGQEFAEGIETHDICDISGHGGSCGV